MNTLELEEYLTHLKLVSARLHVGVSASDNLPKMSGKPVAFICNTDPHYLPGTHWVAIFITENGYGYYFDSFGRPPSGTILMFILRNIRRWFCNLNFIQDISSKICGQYCVLFLLYSNVIYGSMNKFLNIFGVNCKENDAICLNLFKIYFNSYM